MAVAFAAVVAEGEESEGGEEVDGYKYSAVRLWRSAGSCDSSCSERLDDDDDILVLFLKTRTLHPRRDLTRERKQIDVQ